MHPSSLRLSRLTTLATPLQSSDLKGAGVSQGFVARRLNCSVGWFRINRAELEARGFPPPLNMPGHPRWDAAAIDLWFELQRPEHLRAASPAAKAAATNHWNQTLSQRAHEIAGQITPKAAKEEAAA